MKKTFFDHNVRHDNLSALLGRFCSSSQNTSNMATHEMTPFGSVRRKRRFHEKKEPERPLSSGQFRLQESFAWNVWLGAQVVDISVVKYTYCCNLSLLRALYLQTFQRRISFHFTIKCKMLLKKSAYW